MVVVVGGGAVNNLEVAKATSSEHFELVVAPVTGVLLINNIHRTLPLEAIANYVELWHLVQ